MRRAEGVIFAFGPLGETRKPASLSQRANAIAASRQNLVGISLVSDVPHQPIARCVEDIVDRRRQLDHAKAGTEMTAGRADRRNHLRSQLVGNLAKLFGFEFAKLVWGWNRVEQRRVRSIGHIQQYRLATRPAIGSGLDLPARLFDRLDVAILHHRLADVADIPVIRNLMARAIESNQHAFLGAAQIVASRTVMGLDTQLIEDGTYFVICDGADIVGCGGWSARATLYGGDHSVALRDPKPLDPATDAARVRAMYTDPDRLREGIGRQILGLCESAARAAGFSRAEMMATLSGEPLYRACGYAPMERIETPPIDGVTVPLVRMGKALA